jgi:short-chain fatty acids transporter
MMAGIMLGRVLVVGEKGKGLHYLGVVASAYAISVVANGPSMAAPLIVATPGHFIEKLIGIIPLSKTVFDPTIVIMNLFLLITVPLLLYIIVPKKNAVEADESIIQSFTEAERVKLDSVNVKSLTPAQRWDRSPVFMWIVGLAGIFYVGKFIVTKGIANLDLNTLNFAILFIGVLLHGRPSAFMESVKRGTGTVFGVIIQFPFYAGIFGMISYSGLAKIFAGWFVSISTPETFPFIVFVYSGFLNFFVPSGGSKFVIEAPYILPAAQQLGANVNYVINAYTNGDLITNLLQPFWALPIIGAFKGVTFRDILPYSLIVFAWAFVVISVTYLVFMH